MVQTNDSNEEQASTQKAELPLSIIFIENS
jgi:hypothetical protein